MNIVQFAVLFLFISLAKPSFGQQKKYPENFGDIFLKKKRAKAEVKLNQLLMQVDSLVDSDTNKQDATEKVKKEIERSKKILSGNYSPALLGKNIFKGDAGYLISKVSYRDTTNLLKEYYRNAVRINCSFNPWKDFYIRSIFFIDINQPEVVPPWLSNYFYQIGYYNWRNKTFSFGYENFQPNKWNGFTESFFTNFTRGFFFVSYNYFLTKPQNKKHLRPIFWDKTSKLAFTPLIRFHYEYQNEFNEFGGNFKPIIGTTIRYVIVKNIYIETGLFYYPVKKTILSWDPDFTYGFGIFDYRAFKLNFSYGNWIANRFPWNTKQLDNYNFLNGDFLINCTYSW